MSIIPSACSADLATTFTSSKWPNLISASCGSSPYGSGEDQAIDLDRWRPRLSARDSKSFTPDIKLEEIPPSVDEHAPPDAQDRYLIKDEEGNFPCTQVIANTIPTSGDDKMAQWKSSPSYLAGVNEPAHEFRFLGNEHPPREGLEERANEIPFIDHTGDEAPALEPSLVEAANKSALPLSLMRRLLDPEASVTAVKLDQINQAYETFKPHEHNLQHRIQELVDQSGLSPADNPEEAYEMDAELDQMSLSYDTIKPHEHRFRSGDK
ncbi:hypothetical protein ACKAV7_012886 [Fusarium commune]